MSMQSDKIYCIGGQYYSKVYDILTEEMRTSLIQDCDKILLSQRTFGLDPQEPSKELNGLLDGYCEDAQFFFNKKLLRNPCWNILTKTIFLECTKYYKRISNNKLYLSGCWINKVGEYSEDKESPKLCLHEKSGFYTENDYHIHANNHVVSSVYYLQNFLDQCGTIIRFPTGEHIMDGKENSLSIFNPSLYHSPLIPDKNITSKNPRCVIVMEFQDTKIENRHHKI
jgi:hypothetical protein